MSALLKLALAYDRLSLQISKIVFWCVLLSAAICAIIGKNLNDGLPERLRSTKSFVSAVITSVQGCGRVLPQTVSATAPAARSRYVCAWG